MIEINENILEQTTLDWFSNLGWQTACPADVGAPKWVKVDLDFSITVRLVTKVMPRIMH